MFGETETLDELIRTTSDLIAQDPIEISLKRFEWVRTSSGGQTRSGAPVELDPVPRFFAGVVADAVYVTRVEGEQIVCRHVIIGLPGDDIQQKDTFTVDGRNFEVVEIHPEKSFQTKGWVTEKT